MSPLSEVTNVSEAIQAAMGEGDLVDAVAYVCMWDEYRRTGMVAGYPAYGAVVTQLLRVYGIDIQKIARA